VTARTFAWMGGEEGQKELTSGLK